MKGVAVGSFVPWRDAGTFGPGFQFAVDGYTPEDGEENPRARFRIVAPGFFRVLGVRLLAGRDFADDDSGDTEPVSVVSQSVATRFFPNGDAVNRHLVWTDPLFGKAVLRRIVGVVADADDESIVSRPAMTIYQPVRQIGVAGRLFVQAAGNPYDVVPAVRQVIRGISADQPLERPATLEDVRGEVLSSDRLNAFVFTGFAGMALLIAVVGVAGVLAFSVSARTREFGVRLAVGSGRANLLARVLSEGLRIAIAGIAAGGAAGVIFARLSSMFFEQVQLPGALPVFGAATVLVLAAVLASLMPAARASRVDLLQALRSE